MYPKKIRFILGLTDRIIIGPLDYAKNVPFFYETFNNQRFVLQSVKSRYVEWKDYDLHDYSGIAYLDYKLDSFTVEYACAKGTDNELFKAAD